MAFLFPKIKWASLSGTALSFGIPNQGGISYVGYPLGKFYIASSAARGGYSPIANFKFLHSPTAPSHNPLKIAMRGFYEFHMTLLTGTPPIALQAPTIVIYVLVLAGSRHSPINPPGSGKQVAIPG